MMKTLEMDVNVFKFGFLMDVWFCSFVFSFLSIITSSLLISFLVNCGWFEQFDCPCRLQKFGLSI